MFQIMKSKNFINKDGRDQGNEETKKFVGGGGACFSFPHHILDIAIYFDWKFKMLVNAEKWSGIQGPMCLCSNREGCYSFIKNLIL
jgi:hypothetical protein